MYIHAILRRRWVTGRSWPAGGAAQCRFGRSGHVSPTSAQHCSPALAESTGQPGGPLSEVWTACACCTQYGAPSSVTGYLCVDLAPRKGRLLRRGGNNRMVSDVNGVLSVVHPVQCQFHAVFMYLMYIRAILRRRYAVWYAVCCC